MLKIADCNNAEKILLKKNVRYVSPCTGRHDDLCGNQPFRAIDTEPYETISSIALCFTIGIFLTGFLYASRSQRRKSAFDTRLMEIHISAAA